DLTIPPRPRVEKGDGARWHAVAGIRGSEYPPMVGFPGWFETEGEAWMSAQVTSVFLYVNDVVRSLEFYNEIVGAEITQIHAEEEGAPISLAILRIGNFSLMIHPQEPHASEFENTRVGVGIHLQLRVDDIDAFYQHCLDEGALLSVSGEP